MAKFSFNGVDALSASFEQLSQLSDADKMEILMPAAKLLVQRQREKIEQLFTKRTGDLADSLTIRQESGEDGAYAHIYLKGKHRGSSTGKRKGKRRSNGRYSGTNAEVGYILEFGSPRIAARHWMETANEEAADDVVAAEQAAWDDLVTQKGL
jgi:hypothetical protein